MPSLNSVRQAALDIQGRELVRSVRKSREAIAKVQAELRDAQTALLDRDPVFAARVYADAAAQALSKIPPDIAAAIENQQRVSQSLGKQRENSVRAAARAHLSSVPDINAIYADVPAGSASPSLPGVFAQGREWGTLRDRPSDMTATGRESDPTGYERMLQAYFRALAKDQEAPK